MRKRFALAFVIVAALIATSCTGGSEPEDPRDYAEALAKAGSLCAQDSSATPGLESLREIVEREIARFKVRRPPADIAAEHTAYVEAAEALLDAMSDAETLDELRADADYMRLGSSFGDAFEAWESALGKRHGILVFGVSGGSMEPTFNGGEMFVVNTFDGTLDRWNLIMFEFPLDPAQTFFKRVVGLPGEEIVVRDGQIFVDGSPVEGDIYGLETPNYEYGPKVVPEDSYLVLGDNRNTSYDSHGWGSSCSPEANCEFVPKDAVLGELPPEAVGAYCRGA